MPWFDSGQSYPSPGPPQCCRRLPSESNSRIGRRREAALLRQRRVEGSRNLVVPEVAAVHDPDVVVGIDRDPDRGAEQPVVGQRLRPERVHLERRRAFAGGRPRLGSLRLHARNGPATARHGEREERHHHHTPELPRHVCLLTFPIAPQACHFAPLEASKNTRSVPLRLRRPRTRSDRDVHVGSRPAALVPATAVSRNVVGGDREPIVARLGERRQRRCLTAGEALRTRASPGRR